MRPRRVRRGKDHEYQMTQRQSHCFNEAPASSPGKAVRAQEPEPAREKALQ